MTGANALSSNSRHIGLAHYVWAATTADQTGSVKDCTR